jgi:hypothetical protein
MSVRTRGSFAALRMTDRWFWLLLVVIVAEFILFDQFGAHRHTSVYPRWNDQVQYLGEAYTGYEYARTHGFVRGLWQTLVNPSAQGTLHDFGALLAFSVAGPSRSAALALNMLALLAWQAALFVAVTRLGAARSLAFAAALLPVALRGPWDNIPGSAYDFRLDHLAMCALGVAAALAVCTDGFRSRRWSLAFGAAVGISLLTRFLTGTYFALIFVALLAWTLAGAERRARTVNLLFAALLAAVLAAPVFWLNREWVWNYYWVGHYIGPESAIRNAHMNVARSVGFVATQLGQRHLGPFIGWFALAGTIGLGVAAASSRRWKISGWKPEPRERDPWIIGAIFLLAPALVLTLHQQKSEVVVGALVPGALLLAIALWLTLAGRGPGTKPQLAVSGAIAAAAFSFFAAEQFRTAYDAGTLADIRRVNLAADRVFKAGRAAGLREPRVAVDYITDSLDAQVIRVICYERHHVWQPFDMTLPISIAEPAPAEVMERLVRSDFVFLTEEAPPGQYPFDQKLAAMRPQLRAWCDQNLRAVERFPLFGRRMVLYQRREIPLP